MGIYRDVNIGAFLHAKLRMLDIPEDRHVCEKGHDHGMVRGFPSRESSFCVLCGSPVKSVQTTVRRYPYQDELIPLEHEDRLFVPQHTGMPEGEMIFVSNWAEERDSVQMPDGDIGFAPISPEDAPRCIEAFRQNYSDLIAIIEPQVESLEVVFGVLRYAH